MSHWLMIAERKQVQAKIAVQKKQLLLDENYAAHRKAYQDFISILTSLCIRANQLDKNIGEFATQATEKNHSHSFSCCKRFDKITPHIFHPFTKRLHYKLVRKITISPSDAMGFFEIAASDRRLYKMKKHKPASMYYYLELSDKFSQPNSATYMTNIYDLNIKAVINIFDWLAFKEDFLQPVSNCRTVSRPRNLPNTALV